MNPSHSRPRRRIIKHRWILRTLSAAFCLLFISCGAPHSRLILLIIVDTMRADHIGCYGYGSIQTPNIDRLAAEGILYENAITAVPVTLPSVATILTGAYPLQHGLRDNGPFQLDDRWNALAECLQEAGYRTGAFVSAAVLSHEHNLTQGFDIYDDDVSVPYVPYHPWMIPMQERYQGIERRAQVTVDRALAWLQDQSHRDVFLTVHLFDPHLPYDPPPPFRETYPEFYDGEIAYVDREIGRLLEEVRKHRRGSDIVTILVADHGEGLMDHDEALHGDLLFEETMRVPLILHGPGLSPRARVTDLVRTVDIVPTVCALTEISVPAWCVGTPLPGIVWKHDEDAEGRRKSFGGAAYIETFRPRLSHNWCELRGLRTERWKLIEGPGYELYDLIGDPKETTDVAQEYHAVVDSLILLMDEIAFACVRKGSYFAPPLELSQKQREKLQSLGYITTIDTRRATNDSMAVWYFPPNERGAALGLPHPRSSIASTLRHSTAKLHLRLGYKALKEGNLEEAQRNLLEAIRYNKKFAEAYICLAEIARRTGRPSQEIIQFLQQARDVHSKEPEVAKMLVDAFVKMDREDEALRVIDEAIREGFADSALINMRAPLR